MSLFHLHPLGPSLTETQAQVMSPTLTNMSNKTVTLSRVVKRKDKGSGVGIPVGTVYPRGRNGLIGCWVRQSHSVN